MVTLFITIVEDSAQVAGAVTTAFASGHATYSIVRATKSRRAYRRLLKRRVRIAWRNVKLYFHRIYK